MADGIDVVALVRALDAEPLFHMSLGSKELFHSNFIAWFAKRYVDAASAVLGPWAGTANSSSRHRIGREEKNLDLLIELPGYKPLVIENKVFSTPDEIQLERYAQGPAANIEPSPSLVLLSLTDPRWFLDEYRGPNGVWKYVGYDALRNAMLGSIGSIRRASSYDADTIEHYCNLIGLLVKLRDLAAIRDNRDSISLPNDVADVLASVRVGDHAQKFRMKHIGALLRDRLRKEGDDLEPRCDFSNGNPLIEAFVPFNRNDRVGWQYQKGQFRLGLRFESLAGKDPASKQRRESCARGHGGWFDFTRFHAVLETNDETTRSKRVRKDFCHFAPDFVYQYRVPKEMTVGQLLDVGVEYVRAAREFASNQAG